MWVARLIPLSFVNIRKCSIRGMEFIISKHKIEFVHKLIFWKLLYRNDMWCGQFCSLLLYSAVSFLPCRAMPEGSYAVRVSVDGIPIAENNTCGGHVNSRACSFSVRRKPLLSLCLIDLVFFLAELDTYFLNLQMWVVNFLFS